MSYWVSLMDEDGKTVFVTTHSEGGTYVMGGTPEGALNITYNYSPHYYKHLNSEEGLRWLDGKTASETIPALTKAVGALGTNRDSDYWAATEGNAGYALSILLRWALEWSIESPLVTWRVS